MSALSTVASALLRALSWLWSRLRGRVERAVGGSARTRVVVLLAGVLALSSAQISTIGAVAPQLESSLHLDNTQIGLLNSVTLLVSAIAVIPFGLVVDRVRRIPMLSISIVLWSIATILGALAGSYDTLLLTRVVLGVVSAAAGPAVASLIGDYFPSRERGRVYGYILTGEILGTAVGFVICGKRGERLRLAGLVLDPCDPRLLPRAGAVAHRARAAARRPQPTGARGRRPASALPRAHRGEPAPAAAGGGPRLHDGREAGLSP